MYWYKNQHDILVYRRRINVKDISDKILPVNVGLMPVNSETEGHFYFYFEEPCSPFPSGLSQTLKFGSYYAHVLYIVLCNNIFIREGKLSNRLGILFSSKKIGSAVNYYSY